MPVPRVGATLDEYRIEAIAHKGYYSKLMVARDLSVTGSTVVLKFSKPNVFHDKNVRRGFIQETAIHSNVHHVVIGDMTPITAARQTQLYVITLYYTGDTLENILLRGPMPWKFAQKIIIAVAKAIYAINGLHIYLYIITTLNHKILWSSSMAT